MSLPPVAILAGGMATRLYPMTMTIPKALVEVAGKPFIVHQLEQLRQQNIERVVLCVGNLSEQIVALLGDGSAHEITVQYALDGPKLLGTGGALRQALPLLGDEFFVLYGDSYLQCDYAQIYAAYRHAGRSALMTVYRNHNQWDRSNVVFAGDRVVVYDKHQQTPEMQYIDYGLGLLRREEFEQLPADEPSDLSDVYASLAQCGQLTGCEIHQRFYEIGSHQGLAETRAYLESRSL